MTRLLRKIIDQPVCGEHLQKVSGRFFTNGYIDSTSIFSASQFEFRSNRSCVLAKNEVTTLHQRKN